MFTRGVSAGGPQGIPGDKADKVKDEKKGETEAEKKAKEAAKAIASAATSVKLTRTASTDLRPPSIDTGKGQTTTEKTAGAGTTVKPPPPPGRPRPPPFHPRTPSSAAILSPSSTAKDSSSPTPPSSSTGSSPPSSTGSSPSLTRTESDSSSTRKPPPHARSESSSIKEPSSPKSKPPPPPLPERPVPVRTPTPTVSTPTSDSTPTAVTPKEASKLVVRGPVTPPRRPTKLTEDAKSQIEVLKKDREDAQNRKTDLITKRNNFIQEKEAIEKEGEGYKNNRQSVIDRIKEAFVDLGPIIKQMEDKEKAEKMILTRFSNKTERDKFASDDKLVSDYEKYIEKYDKLTIDIEAAGNSIVRETAEIEKITKEISEIEGK